MTGIAPLKSDNPSAFLYFVPALERTSVQPRTAQISMQQDYPELVFCSRTLSRIVKVFDKYAQILSLLV